MKGSDFYFRPDLNEFELKSEPGPLRPTPNKKPIHEQLEDLKTKAIDQVMESGTPEDLIKQLDQTTKKIGIAWVIDTSKIKQIEA